MQILFVADFSPIVTHAAESGRFYMEALGLPLKGEPPASGQIAGAKHFGLWPLREAAQACFGQDDWPNHLPIPQANLEFEVLDVAAAAAELEARGYTLLHPARTEPWGQTLVRTLSPEGLIVGLCYTPWFHQDTASHSE